MKKLGFTIVELIVVIVVISILATMSVAAYSGINVRAQNAQMIAAVNTYVKYFKVYKEQSGGYPVTVTQAGVQLINTPGGLRSQACLGASFPATSVFPSDACRISGSGAGMAILAYYYQPVNDALMTVSNNLPDTSKLTTVYGALNNRGIIYIGDAYNNMYRIDYSLVGHFDTCPVGRVNANMDDQSTLCSVEL